MTTLTERTLSDPQSCELRLEAIESELAEKANSYELAAALWFKEKGKRKKERAKAMLLSTKTTVADREADADEQTAEIGAEIEGEYEALKGSMEALESRATIVMAVLKSQLRAAA